MRLPFHKKRNSLSHSPTSIPSSTTSVPSFGTTLTPSTQPSSSQATPPAHFTPGYKIQPEEIRQLTELIRMRYREDLDIWGARSVTQASYSDVRESMNKSDEILRKIKQLVEMYDQRALFEKDSDWDKFQDIKVRIMKPGKAHWENNPPWNDPDRHKYY